MYVMTGEHVDGHEEDVPLFKRTVVDMLSNWGVATSVPDDCIVEMYDFLALIEHFDKDGCKCSNE
jgi:hypothetical protein